MPALGLFPGNKNGDLCERKKTNCQNGAEKTEITKANAFKQPRIKCAGCDLNGAKNMMVQVDGYPGVYIHANKPSCQFRAQDRLRGETKPKRKGNSKDYKKLILAGFDGFSIWA